MREQIAPLNQPKAHDRFRLTSGRETTGKQLRPPAKQASTDAFHLAMLIGAGLLFAGAAVNGVGIRNPERPPAPPEAREEALTEEPPHEEVGVGAVAGTPLHDELHDRGELHHHHVCTAPPLAGSPVSSGDRAAPAET